MHMIIARIENKCENFSLVHVVRVCILPYLFLMPSSDKIYKSNMRHSCHRRRKQTLSSSCDDYDDGDDDDDDGSNEPNRTCVRQCTKRNIYLMHETRWWKKETFYLNKYSNYLRIFAYIRIPSIPTERVVSDSKVKIVVGRSN